MKRSGKMEKVSEAFQEAEGVLRGNDAFQFWLFQQRWPSIIGDVLAEESYIGRRDGKRLFLYVTNSTASNSSCSAFACARRAVTSETSGSGASGPRGIWRTWPASMTRGDPCRR